MFQLFRQLSICLIILAVLSTARTAFAGKEGPESGGGGGVVFIQNQPQLTDFFTIVNSAEIVRQAFANQPPSYIEKEISVSFETSASMKDIAFVLAASILSKWSQLPFDTMGLWINIAMTSPVVWEFTDQKIMAPKFYRPDLLPKNSEIITAAYYSQKLKTYTVHISRAIWNQLSLENQVGLLIHESLRHIQIGISFSFDDEALQKATAMMMTCKPRVKHDQYLFYLLNNRRDLAKKYFEPFEQLTNECWR